jgi:peptidoglycan/xylan/chitin deacetylase (PgdA/CDA1 family)
MTYWVKTPRWLKRLFPKEMIWSMPPCNTPTVYITFDDGPHPTATPFAMAQLEEFDAKATFFCIGKNVVAYPGIYEELLKKGHATGNHTHNHVNGWKTDNSIYIDNILKAKQFISGLAFRPPYGRIRLSQAKWLLRSEPGWKIYMWDVLSCDFDINLTPERCLDNVLSNIEPGSIVVFHDSEKAWERMSFTLPKVLAYCKQQNWELSALPIS